VRSDDPRLRRFEADGQRLYVPDPEALDAVVRTGHLDGRPVGTGRLLSQYAALANAVDGLVVALGAVLEPDQPWWVYHAVVRDPSIQRIKVESHACPACGLALLTGNHRDFALYVGTVDPMATLAAHWDDPPARCVGCNAPLTVPATWAARTPG
jgi:hypothetical protein